MEAYDDDYVPAGFALNNVGAICHFNALMQGLASCPSLVKSVIDNRDYMAKTATGGALYNFMRAVELSSKAVRDGGDFIVDATHSLRVLQALIGDLCKRRPKTRFTTGMESATEGLVLLLDMVEHPSEVASAPEDETAASTTDAAATVGQWDNPIARLFQMRIRDRVWCKLCAEDDKAKAAAETAASGTASEIAVDSPKNPPGVVSLRLDTMYQYNYFHFDTTDKVTTPHAFASHLLKQVNALSGFKCEKCAAAGRKVPAPRTAFRLYEMRLIPPILVVLFNQYQGHRQRYFPQRFRVEGANKGVWLRYRQVAQIEHSGNLHSGHYWTRGLRRVQTIVGPAVQPHLLNDSQVSPGQGLMPTPSVYTVIYHYDGDEGPEE